MLIQNLAVAYLAAFLLLSAANAAPGWVTGDVRS